MVNAKTPNKKRKSLANSEGVTQGGQTPNVAKLNTSLKTPGKGKGNATPGKFIKSPKNIAQTPKASQDNVAKTPKQTPFKNQQQASGKANKRNKRASESGSEGSPPKKLMMFSGTSELQEAQGKKKQEGKAPVNKKETQKKKNVDKEGKKIKRKGQFFQLKEKVNSGDKTALQELEGKIKAFETRKELTKTAKRKLKFLQRLRSIATGEKRDIQTTAPSLSKKRREMKKEVKGRKGGEGEPAQQVQKKGALLKAKKEEGDSDESDYEVEAEVKPGSIIKLAGSLGEEDSEDDEEEEESGDEEEESGVEEEDSGEEEDESDEDDSDEEEGAPAIIPKGGKKKGEEKKNEVKVKNLKLQAMRKQGQLAGSVKQNQKRSARRGKKNVNGASS